MYSIHLKIVQLYDYTSTKIMQLYGYCYAGGGATTEKGKHSVNCEICPVEFVGCI